MKNPVNFVSASFILVFMPMLAVPANTATENPIAPPFSGTSALTQTGTPQLRDADLTSLKFEIEISGFGYKSSSMAGPGISTNTKAVLETVIPLMRKIPDTYKIIVSGYADATGPEDYEGEKPGNLAISRDRAQAVVDYIEKKYGLSSEKFTVSGMGSSELKDTRRPDSAVNRRVIIKFDP